MSYKSSLNLDKCEYKRPHTWMKHDLTVFHSLPEQAQDIYLSYFWDLTDEADNDKAKLDDLINFKEMLCLIPSEVHLCKSPIEKTLYCAIYFVGYLKYFKTLSHGYYVEPQYKIRTDKQNRIMDFVVIDEEPETEDNIALFIECDGFDYHAKTKEQFTYTQQKDRELKTMGYDVLHFTGTEINYSPLKCACEVWEYIEKKEKHNG